MKNFLFTFLFLFLCSISSFGQLVNGWKLFEQVKFEERYNEDIDFYVSYPKFDSKIKAYEGKIVELKGYLIPLEKENDFYFFSKYPYEQCYFCGGAGPESAAMVYFKTDKKRPYNELITIRGYLKLNDSNVDYLNFIIKKSIVVPTK